jgi:hypothetical protein
MAEPHGDPRLVRWAKWVTAVVAAPAAVVGFVLLVLPYFDGDGEAAPDCPSAREASLSDAQVERSVSYGDYLKLVDADPGGATPERLNQPGKLIDVEVAAVGWKDERLDLESWVLTENGAVVTQDGLTHQLAATVTPSECTEELHRKVWVRIPQRRGRFKIELRLVDQDDVLRGQTQTEPFAGAAA